MSADFNIIYIMDSSSVLGVKRVKVYFRNQQKMARIMHLPEVTPAKQVYQLVSNSYGVHIDRLHLFYGGVFVEMESQMKLLDNSIVHMVNLDELKSDILSVNVKKIGGKINAIAFQTTSETKIKDFIDGRLSIVYGLRSDAVFLVHMGRQLSIQKTFREEEVQTNAELLCLQFQSQQQKQKQALLLQEEPSHEYMVNVKLKQESDIKSPKNIYPQQNFTIQTPNDLDSIFHLNLIFNANVRKSSSIRDIDFNPDEIIEEEDYFEESKQGRENVYRSEGPNSNKKSDSVVSHFSEKVSDSFISLDSRNNNKKQSHKTNLSRENLLYGDCFQIGKQKKHIMQEILKGYGQITSKKDRRQQQRK